MAEEIERKFLPKNDGWRRAVHKSTRYHQGYLRTGTDSGCSVRVRIEGDEARLNIKSMTLGASRAEFEFPIPTMEARALLEMLCARPFIDKVRHFVEHQGHTWEIDVFEGDNAGLVVAEIELNNPDETFARPEWLGEEVTDDPRYYNVNLAQYPYKDWRKK
ncbi:MAG TPA: CYTH domain-containing protein [Gammaproteobacteria bacterium]|nr:CYTH domain-containing protein [Gammaproteobacteria bacterium]